jgi:hypothetical protein
MGRTRATTPQPTYPAAPQKHYSPRRPLLTRTMPSFSLSKTILQAQPKIRFNSLDSSTFLIHLLSPPSVQLTSKLFSISSIDNTDSRTSGASPPNLVPIIAGVVGGVACLVLLVFLILWWMRRQRRLAGGSDITHIRDLSLHSPFTDNVLFSEARTVAGSSTSMLQTQTTPFIIPPYPLHQQVQPPYHNHDHDYDYTAAPPTQIDYHTGAGAGAEDDGASTNVDGLTYYTLPSYHERVRDRPAAQNLSNADVDAISRRLQEIMRQSGVGRNSLVVVDPPRELIDHLVELQSSAQPRAP